MELYQLKAFATVAEEGNVTRAAARLFSSQPAVSAQIKALEQEFGVELFTRTPAGMRLTDAGERLLARTRSLLQHTRGLEDLARQLRDGVAGVLRVGVNNPVQQLRLDDLGRALMEDFPELLMHLEHGPSGVIYKGIKNYDLDIGFVEGDFSDPSVQFLPIGANEIHIVAPAAWGPDLPGDDWRVLQRHPWVFTSPDCSYHRLLESLCNEHSLELQKQFRIDADGAALDFVRKGLALSMVDRYNAEPALQAGEVVLWPGFVYRMPLHLCVMRRRLDEGPIQAFLSVCRDVYDLDPVAAS